VAEIEQVFYPGHLPMRWDNLRLVDPAPSGGMTTPLFEQGAVVRTFDTPEFKGMTFYEVRARSIINRVPEASRVPFRWTINPYRGCSHACVYCADGATPILMADGRTKPLQDLCAGDEVYGTERIGRYRRYVRTTVLAHWSTVKPAYRVVLEDGTELVASGDHRFLTRRRWKHVTGSEQGANRRPFLTTNDRMLGVGRFAVAPEDNHDYRLGYLCGMVRGDGSLGSYTYDRPDRGPGTVHRFRLALVDLEGIQRTRRYLDDLGVGTQEFLFQEAVGARQPVRAIRTSTRAGVDGIRGFVAWPDAPSPDWCKGFLAGIFDAEGSYSRGILRIANTDLEVVQWVVRCLRRLSFAVSLDASRKERPVLYVRVLGGLREHLRFFHTVDPAITRKRSIEGTALKGTAPLRVAAIEPLGLDLRMYDITTGTGDFIANGVVSHNCFARNTHTYLDLDAGEDFNRQIVVKVNAPELLRKELAHKTWKGEHIAMGTNVDPYQRAEGRYRLMVGILEAMRDARQPFSILTKGSLILRDLELLQACAEVSDVGTNVSVGFTDRAVWRLLEPGTPAPHVRLDVCRTLNEGGIGCGVLMAPIIPFLTDGDEQLEETVRAIAESGATHISPIVLHLRTGAREWFLAWLAEHHPELVAKYEQLYRNRAYAPKAFQQEIGAKVDALARRYQVGRRGPEDARRIRPKNPPHVAEPAEQLPLL
jgi:DNA repair photolyase